jgi:hypothetical protein
MKESKVETYLTEQVESVGGLCEKHVSPGRRAAPDRLITWPSGTMELVETKAPRKKPREEQVRDHERRARRRVKVYVIDTLAKVQAYMHEHRDHWRGYDLL